MALEAATPLGVPYIVARQVKETWSKDRYKLNDYRFLVDEQGSDSHKKTIELCTPVWDARREIFVIWDDVDKKVYYTDADLLTMAEQNRLEEFDSLQNKTTQKKLLQWRELIEGFPYYAHGTWNYFFTKTQKRYPFDMHKVNIRYSLLTAPNGKKYRQYTARAGRFFADLKDYKQDSPLPEDLQWRVSVPETPWAQTYSKLHNGFALDNRLVRVPDLPSVVFLVDDTLRRTLFWDSKARKWKDYTVRDPGYGPYADLPFQRDGVRFDSDLGAFIWRDPVNMALYILAAGDDYKNPSLVTDIELLVGAAVNQMQDMSLKLPTLMDQLDSHFSVQYLINMCRSYETDVKGAQRQVDSQLYRLRQVKAEKNGGEDVSKVLERVNDKINLINEEYRQAVRKVVQDRINFHTPMREMDLPIMDSLVKEYGKLHESTSKQAELLKRPNVPDLARMGNEIWNLYKEYKLVEAKPIITASNDVSGAIKKKRDDNEKNERLQKLTAELVRQVSLVHNLYDSYPLNDEECRRFKIKIIDKEKTDKFVLRNQETLRKCTLITQKTYLQNSLISSVLNNSNKQNELHNELKFLLAKSDIDESGDPFIMFSGAYITSKQFMQDVKNSIDEIDYFLKMNVFLKPELVNDPTDKEPTDHAKKQTWVQRTLNVTDAFHLPIYSATYRILQWKRQQQLPVPKQVSESVTEWELEATRQIEVLDDRRIWRYTDGQWQWISQQTRDANVDHVPTERPADTPVVVEPSWVPAATSDASHVQQTQSDDWDGDGFIAPAAQVPLDDEWFHQFLPEDHFLGARAVYLHPIRSGKGKEEGLCPRCHLVVKSDVPRMQVDGVFWHFACYKKQFQRGQERRHNGPNRTTFTEPKVQQGGQGRQGAQGAQGRQGAQGAQGRQQRAQQGAAQRGPSQKSRGPGQSYRQKAQKGSVERKGPQQGSAAPPPDATGSFELFTLREAVPSNVSIKVQVEELKGNKDMNTHKQQSIFSYTDACTWNTYIFKTYETLTVNIMPEWHRVSRVTEDPFRLFTRKQQALQEKKSEQLLAQAKTLGRIFQGRRLTKKICTGLNYLAEDHERASEQALDCIGAVIYPLDEEQARALKFEITAAVNTDQRDNRMRELRQRKSALLMISNPNATEEATPAAPLRGQFLGMESKQRRQEEALQKARKATVDRSRQGRDFVQRDDDRSGKTYYHDKTRDRDEYYEEGDSMPLEKPAALTDNQWSSALRSYERDSRVQELVNPDAKDVVLFDDHDEVMVRPKRQDFGLLRCFVNFRTYMHMLLGVNIPLHRDLHEVMGKIKELDESEADYVDRLQFIRGLYNRVLQKYVASTERLLVPSIPGGVNAIKYRNMDTDTWADAVVLAHMFGVILIGMEASEAVTSKWNVRIDNSFNMYEFEFKYEINILQLHDEALAPNGHYLLMPKPDYIRMGLVRYVREYRSAQGNKYNDASTVSYMDEIENKTGTTKVVESADGKHRLDLAGKLAIFNLILHEQPWTNYSFFSTCRDALAEHLQLKTEDIAMLPYFVMIWFNYLRYLPEEAIRRVRTLATSRSNKTPQQIIIDEVLDPLHQALRIGADVQVTPRQLKFLAAAGVPISAATGSKACCKENEKRLKVDHLPIHFFSFIEEENRVVLPNDSIYGEDIMLQKVNERNDFLGVVSIPFLLLVSYGVTEVQIVGSSNKVVRGAPTAHHYHLLCASNPQKKMSSELIRLIRRIHTTTKKDEKPAVGDSNASNASNTGNTDNTDKGGAVAIVEPNRRANTDGDTQSMLYTSQVLLNKIKRLKGNKQKTESENEILDKLHDDITDLRRNHESSADRVDWQTRLQQYDKEVKDIDALLHRRKAEQLRKRKEGLEDDNDVGDDAGNDVGNDVGNLNDVDNDRDETYASYMEEVQRNDADGVGGADDADGDADGDADNGDDDNGEMLPSRPLMAATGFYDPNYDHLPHDTEVHPMARSVEYPLHLAAYLGVIVDTSAAETESTGYRPDSGAFQVAMLHQGSHAMSLVDARTTNLRVQQQKTFVTNVFGFPSLTYFMSVRRAFPGVNGMPVSKSLWAVQQDTPPPDPLPDDTILRFCAEEDCTYRFEEVYSSIPGDVPIPSYVHVSTKQGMRIAELHESILLQLFRKKEPLPKTEFIIPCAPMDTVEQFMRRTYDQRAREFIMHFTPSEYAKRAKSETSEVSKQKEEQEWVWPKQLESLKDLYLAAVVSFLPSDQRTVAWIQRESVSLQPTVTAWLQNAMQVHHAWFTTATYEQKDAYCKFGFVHFLRVSVEEQWMQAMQDSIVAHAAIVSTANFNREWNLKGKNDEERRVFMTQEMMPPRNTALAAWFTTLGFERGVQKDLLTDICTTSLVLPHRSDFKGTAYAQDVLRRICEAFFINLKITDSKAALTMATLKVLSRTYSSANEASKDRFLYRGVASPNFIVVENTGASALAGQLKVVLTSDPRGLALACAMQGKTRLLPKNVSDLPQAARLDEKGVADHFQAMNYIRDAFQACNVAVFLREGDSVTGYTFTQLLNVGAVKSVSLKSSVDNVEHFSLSAVLAGARVARGVLRGVFVDEARLKLKKLQPFEREDKEEESKKQERNKSLNEAKKKKMQDDVEEKRYGRPRLDELVAVLYPNVIAEHVPVSSNKANQVFSRKYFKLSGNSNPVITNFTDARNIAQQTCQRFFILTGSDELNFKECYDFRCNVSTAQVDFDKDTQYFLLNGGKLRNLLPALHNSFVDKPNGKTHSDMLELIAPFTKFTTALRENVQLELRKIEALRGLLNTIGVSLPKETVTYTKLKDKTRKLKVGHGPDPDVWRRRYESHLLPPQWYPADDHAYNFSVWDSYTDNLVVFHAMLQRAVDDCFEAVWQKLPSLINPLAGISAREACSFRNDPDLRNCYNKLRMRLQKHQQLYINVDFNVINESAQALHNNALLPYTHDRGFETRLYNALRASNTPLALQHAIMLTESVKEMLSAASILREQTQLMRLFESDAENQRFFVAVTAESASPEAFKHRVVQRLNRYVTGYFDPAKKCVYSWDHLNSVADELELLLPFWDPVEKKLFIMPEQFTGCFEFSKLLLMYQKRASIMRQKEAEQKTVLARARSPAAKKKAAEKIKWLTDKLERYTTNINEMQKRVDDILTQHRQEWNSEPVSGVYKYTCSQNGKMYVLDASSVSACTYLRIVDCTSAWSEQKTHPVFNAFTNTFIGDVDVWFNPTDSYYYYQDYDRQYWNMHARTPNVWQPARKQMYFIEVESNTHMDTLMQLVVDAVGLHRQDFSFYGFNPHNTVQNLRFTTRRVSDTEIFQISTIYLKCTDKDDWPDDYDEQYNGDSGSDSDGSEDDHGFRVVRLNRKDAVKANHSEGGTRGGRLTRREQESARRKEDKRALKTVGQGTGKAAAYAIYPLHNSCSFDAIRFLNILSGYANNIAVDFGSTVSLARGEFIKERENPIVTFREAWILQTDFLDEENHSQTLIVRRVMYKGNKTHYTAGCMVCNATGIDARFVERYWGYNLDLWQLTAKTKFIVIVHKDKTRETREVANKHALFTERVKAFYDWIRTPRNWYWDKETNQFYVFTFSSEMLRIDGSEPSYVQQMVCYNVTLFYWHNDQTQQMFESFMMDRSHARETWEKLEDKYKFPPDLLERMQREEKGADFIAEGYSWMLYNDINKYYNDLTSAEPEVRSSFVDYYQRVLSYVVYSPPVVGRNGNIQKPPVPVFRTELQLFQEQRERKYNGLPKLAEPIVSIGGLLNLVKRQHMQTRRFFWRLFEAKFGFPYYEFMSNREKCREVLHMCPEAFGPRCNGPTDNVNEGSEFRDGQRRGRSYSQYFRDYLPNLTSVERFKERIDAYIETLQFCTGPTEEELQNLEEYYMKHATVQDNTPTKHAHEKDSSDESDDSD